MPPARGLLLRHAVERAEAPDQIDGVDADHRAGREQRGQHLQRDAVVRVVEGRHQHGAVARCRSSRSSRAGAARRRRAARASAASRRAAGAPSAVVMPLEPRAVLAQRRVVRVVAGRLAARRRPCVGVDEARQVVDVAVGVVAGDAAARARAPCARPGTSREHAPPAPRASRPGLRACTVGRAGTPRSSAACRAPLTSIAPPSSTTRAALPADRRGRLPLPQRLSRRRRDRRRRRRACGWRTSPSR